LVAVQRLVAQRAWREVLLAHGGESANDTIRRVAAEFDIELQSGRLHAKRYGPRDTPLVLGVPGLTANLQGFEFLGERLATVGIQFVALDLRGRGRSDVTEVGSYGWVKHAADLFAVADHLDAKQFSLIGHSMGAAVAMAAAAQDAARLTRVVLVDMCGVPDPSTAAPIGASVARLGTVFPSVEAYLDLFRHSGIMEPWSEYWEHYFRYELQPVDGGVAARTSRAAVMEDVMFGAGACAFDDAAGVYGLWASLSMPVLLLRATREMILGSGFILSKRDRDRFPVMVESATAVDIDANHYTIATSEAAASAIIRFLEPTH
jgi:pimeloyl-ACP methyl ester carboxylesterase